MKRFWIGACGGWLLGLLPAHSVALAQQGAPYGPQRNFSGLVSGYEAWELGDVQRRAEIARQVDLNADMYWRWSGAGSYYRGVFEPWPMVPGSIWGWPAAVAPPLVSSTRPRPFFGPFNPQAPGVIDPAQALGVIDPPVEELAAPPGFVPQAAPVEPLRRRLPEGPREF